MNTSFNPTADFLANAGSERRRKFPWLNVVLFAATCFTTLLMGTLLMADFRGTLGPDLSTPFRAMWRNPSVLFGGLPFSVAIMTILFAHEMGHYLACQYYGIDASLPYFIPAPTPMGTMGAFIRIRSIIHNRAALLDVGIGGPIAGFVLAVPAFAIGLMKSRFAIPDPSQTGLGIGEPLIFKLLVLLTGKTPPAGMELVLHPIALAAWFGFLATALNLLPVGQLDGGHVAYALLSRYHKRISQGFVVALIPLGIFYWQGWLVWTAMLLFIGLRHPATLDDWEPVQRRHVWLGWVGLAMFILCFTPIPFYLT